MADNITFQTGEPATPPFNTVVATDLINGVNYQRVKVTYGDDGSATDASAINPLPVTDAAAETSLSTLVTEAGSLTETVPASDTASSGLNGRLQRIAQRITSLLDVFPTTIDTNSGVKSASTLRVVLATDQPQLTNKLLVTPDANSAVNVAQLAGTVTDTNSGVKSAGTLRVVLATDQPQLTNKLLVTPDANSAVNLAQVGGSSTATGHGTATGALRVELSTDGTGQIATVSAVTAITNALPAGTNMIGGVTGATSAASGGIANTSRLLSAAASTNSTLVKNSAGRIYSIQCYNAATSVRYLKLYNKATAPTVGTDTPVKTIPLPPSTGMILDWGNIGYSFSAGVGFGLTTGSADNDTGALTAADVVGLGIDYV